MQESLNYTKRMIVGLIIIFALLFLCGGIAILYHRMLPTVTIKVNNVTIRQEEVVPEFEVEVEFEGEDTLVLDEAKKYTMKELLFDLNQGRGVTVSPDSNHMEEGKHKIHIVLDRELEMKLKYTWGNKINYKLQSGTLEVLNKYGDWEGKKFRFLDGTYASGWLNLGADTFYFDAQGEYVTGEYAELGNVYYFRKDGKFDTKKNKVNPNRPMIALTFDDGPDRYTMQLLEQLETYGARATFFMVGTNVVKYPETVKKMQEIGCELGNHTNNHIRLTTLDDTGVLGQIGTTNASISQIVGQEATAIRPPYGLADDRVAKLSGKPLIMWSVDTLDWENKNAVSVSNYVLSAAKDGEIILLHDIHETTVQAAIDFIPKLIDKGYQLVTVSEMAKARGITLKPGMKYYHFRQ